MKTMFKINFLNIVKTLFILYKKWTNSYYNNANFTGAKLRYPGYSHILSDKKTDLVYNN